jgi:hypothetical protein
LPFLSEEVGSVSLKGLKKQHSELDDYIFSAGEFYSLNCTNDTVFPVQVFQGTSKKELLKREISYKGNAKMRLIFWIYFLF